MLEAIFFREEEAAYQEWLASHPDGWVLNTKRTPDSRYLILHRAHCHTINEYRQHEGRAAFTGGRYAKVCAEHPSALLSWVKQRGFDTFTGFCTSCKTSEDSLVMATANDLVVTLANASENPGDDDARREGQIRVRRGQAKFRAKLLKAYEGRCAVTGTKLALLLEAAHIVPHAFKADYRLANGLLLRADIHTLFDLYHLSVDDNGQVHLSKELQQTDYIGYHGMMSQFPSNAALQPSIGNLAVRHERFLKAEKERR